MAKAASCVPADGLSTKDYGKIFNYICSKEDGKYCVGINGNSTTGIYGAYSMCSAETKLAFALDSYYQGQNSASTACDFNGQAKTQKGDTSDSCKDSLAAASSVNSKAATATAPVSQPTSSGDGDSAGMPHAQIASVFSLGSVAVSLYAVVAVGVGAGMTML